MSNYSALKTDINNNIYENNTQQITGTVLNTVLKDMVNTLGAGYQFAGCAYLDLNPGAPDAKVFYLAGEGLYTNFDNIQVPAGKLGILKWDTRWHLETIEGLGGGGANLTGYISVASTDNLPEVGEPTLGYLCGTNLYLYVGEGGDTKEGKYQNCGSFRGPEGVGITEIEQVEQSTENGGRNTIRIHLSNGTSYDVYTRNGTTSTGLFPTLADLQAAHPTPVVGQYAFVGAGFPADIYVCQTAGTWTDSGADYDGDNVDLTDYATKDELAQLEQEVNGLNANLGISDIGYDADTFMNFTTGVLSEMTGQNCSKPIPLIQGMIYNILWDNNTGGWATDKSAIWGYKEDGTTPVSGSMVISSDGKHITYSSTDPEVKCFRIRLSSYQIAYPSDFSLTYQADGIVDKIDDISDSISALENDMARQKVYVAKTGADTNDGTKEHPFLTIGKALTSAKQNGTVIFVLSGDYKEAIDVASSPAEDVSICAASPFDTVRIYGGEEYALTKDGNYNNIYYSNFELRDSPNGEKIAYLDGIQSLPVSLADSFPQMHGKKNRLPFIEFTNRLTKDYETLADALTFMDGQSEDCLYYDADNERVYVHSLTDLTGESLTVPDSPTCKKAPVGCNKSFHCIGIDFVFGYASDLVNYHDGGFASNNLLLAEFIKCGFLGNYRTGLMSNALRSVIVDCESGGNGNDGFGTQLYNADYNIPERLDFTVIYESCWSHDNYDDGFTDHTRGRDILKDCLSSYNYNGDGFHFVATSCVELIDCVAYKCRNHGFVFAGQSSDEGRLGLSAILMNCVAKECRFNYELSVTAYPAIVRLYDCKSIGSTNTGYRISGTSNGERALLVVDCKTHNDTTVLSKSADENATLSVINTDIVTPLI